MVVALSMESKGHQWIARSMHVSAESSDRNTGPGSDTGGRDYANEDGGDANTWSDI